MKIAIFSQISEAVAALLWSFKPSALGLGTQNSLSIRQSVCGDPLTAFCLLRQVSLAVIFLFVETVLASGPLGVRSLSAPPTGEFSPDTATCATRSATRAAQVEIGSRKFVASDAMSLRCPFAVCNVLSQRTDPQVIRIDALGHAAKMVDGQLFRYRTSCEFVCKSMGDVIDPLVSKSTITESISRSNPEPASSCLQDLLVISFIERIGTHRPSMDASLLKWKTFEVPERTRTWMSPGIVN